MQNQKTVSISEDVHRRIKSVDALRRMSLSTLVNELLTNSLDSTVHETETDAADCGVSVTAGVPAPTLKIFYTDAGTQDNGGLGQSSRICVHDGNVVVVDEVIGNYTINQAEMMAIEKAIKLIGLSRATIYSDSQLAVNMITHRWNGKQEHLIQLAKTIKLPSNISLVWIPREKNLSGQYLEEKYTKRESLPTPQQSQTKLKKSAKRNRWQMVKEGPKPKASTLSAKELIERLYGTH